MVSDAQWVVHKFGGTSVAGTDRYRGVGTVLDDLAVGADYGMRQAVVVSAMSKVTDSLIELVALAQNRDPRYLQCLAVLAERHYTTLDELLEPPNQSADYKDVTSITRERRNALRARIEADVHDIEQILRGVWLVRASSERTQELIAGHGELWSAQILAAYLASRGKDACWLDARDVLVVQSDASGVVVNWESSRAKIAEWLKTVANPLVIITGFIASTEEGLPTTLRRNGSDYSASIFGSLLAAREISIWTDVDGVLSADPRLVPEAVVLSEMSYAEATELAYFGAKVVHPNTMAPAVAEQIPIWIRNTFNPKHPGTRIGGPRAGTATHGSTSPRLGPVKGFSTIEPMTLVNVEGTGMMGVPGIAQRLFGALREVGVSVVMISQASSEHSICFAIPEAHAALTKSTVEKAFFAELHHGQIERVDSTSDCSILAAVGDAMAEEPGVAAKFFGALGAARVNIRAIAQGSSERNISVVVDRSASKRALRAVHSAFFLSHQTISIGLIGPGLIGETLLRQLHEQAEVLRTRFNLDLRVRGIASRAGMVLSSDSEPGINLAGWKERNATSRQPLDLVAFAKHIQADHLPHAVLIDCTSSEDVTAHYATWMAAGLHLVTPNKKGNAGTMASYEDVHATARRLRRHYLYETTVGAGLPIIGTLRDLVQTGDRILRIEGVLSGTLSYIFCALEKGESFSSIVAEAKARGYTEPDPRDDLSGTDVGRKVVILAREMGLSLELSDIEVESLVPADLRAADVTLEAFMQRLPQSDAAMATRERAARADGSVLRFVGSIERDEAGQFKARATLRAYPLSHPFARISPGDNIVAFTTSRYSLQPLVVQGPGAGPEVTAAGVFADLLRLGSYLGASR